MIKLKDLLSEEFNHPVYGSHTTNFLVKRPFDVFIKTGRLEPTGMYSTPGPGGSKEMFRDVGKKVKVKSKDILASNTLLWPHLQMKLVLNIPATL